MPENLDILVLCIGTYPDPLLFHTCITEKTVEASALPEDITEARKKEGGRSKVTSSEVGGDRRRPELCEIHNGWGNVHE